jgi:Skp family chaperone for outer membrane proteins
MRNRLSPVYFVIALLLSIGVGYPNGLANTLKSPTQALEPTSQASFYAVLDIDRIINQSVAYKEFKIRWGRINDKFQKEIEFYESQLAELDKRVAMVPNKEGTISDKQKIGLYEVKVQNLLRERKKILDGTFEKAMEILKKNIDQLIREHAKQNKLSIIFDRSQVLHFSDTVDITSMILNKLNSRLQKLEVNI